MSCFKLHQTLWRTKYILQPLQTISVPQKFLSQSAAPSNLAEVEQKNSAPSLVNKNLLTLRGFNREQLRQLLWTAAELKTRIKEDGEIYQPLKGKSIGMIFQKRSTRTRLSTESGMAALGGHPVFLGPQDIHLGVNESLKDTAKVMSGMVDCILARVYGHDDIEELGREASVPVINGLSDMHHPLQILADMLTLHEHFHHLRGLKIAWVGDGNNIAHSFMMVCPKLGIDLSVATPKGYECHPSVVQNAAKLAAAHQTHLTLTDSPADAVHRADAIVTDTWISMGQEEEKEERMKAFAGYKVTQQLCSSAKPGWVFLHCLPRKQEEVSDNVFYNPEHSLVWQEAENRKWTVMSVILNCLTNHTPTTPKFKIGPLDE